jgi:hypothetical protein
LVAYEVSFLGTRVNSLILRLAKSVPKDFLILEAAPGFEPGVKLLQSLALPLGYAAFVF